MSIKIKTPVMPEPFWHAVVSKQAPIINKAICRADVAQEYADKVEESYVDVADITVKQLFTAEQLAARDAQWIEVVGPVVEALQMAKPYLIVAIAEHAMAYQGHPAEAASRALMEKELNAVIAALSAITEE